MLSVGYGDYHPISKLGKVICVCSGILGVSFFSFTCGAIGAIIAMNK